SITALTNDTVTVYARTVDALANASACTFMANYTHDDIPPNDPTYSSTDPVSPNGNATPKVIGGASVDTATVKLFNDNNCTTEIGSGTRASFIGAGITATVDQVATTSIY